MSKKRNASRKTKSGNAGTLANPSDTFAANHPANIVYGALALFWLYAGISTAVAAFDIVGDDDELRWLIPAAVAFFAVGWFLYHFVNLAAVRERVRLAQLLFLAFFVIFLAGMLPFFLNNDEVLRSGSQAYLSFGLAGLLLRISISQRQRGGLLNSLLSRHRK